MNDEFDIEIEDGMVQQSSAMQLPLNFITVGEVEPDDVKVYIKQSVYHALEKYALADTEHERGTIILGQYCEQLGKRHVIISNYIEAKYTDASASTLTFTHETWDYIHREHDANYPKEKIVGWQHTHPSYGIFLSNYDLFIQENFFNLPFQVAYVIDPIQNLRGFFQWKDGKIEKLHGFYIYDEVGKAIKLPQTKTQKKQASIAVKNQWRMCMWILLTLIIFSASGIFYMKSVYNLRNADRILSEYQASLEQEQIVEEIQDTTTSESDALKISELEKQLELKNEEIKSQGIQIGDLEKQLEDLFAEKEQYGDLFFLYKVKQGDSIWDICHTYNIDFSKKINQIEEINHLENRGNIWPGQMLFLPIGE